MDHFSDLFEGRLAIPLSPRAVWKFTGADRVRYLNGQVTHDVVKLQPGNALHAAVCHAKGKMEGEVWITATPEALWVDAPWELRESLGLRLERYIIADDVTMEDHSETRMAWHFPGKLPGHLTATVSSTRYGRPGYDVWSDGDTTGIPPSAPAEWIEQLRIEQAIPLWGREMNSQTLPPEAGLDRDAISYTKGCYIGQEVIARIKSKGHVNKKLARLTGNGTPPAPLPQTLHHEGKEAGILTSACPGAGGSGWIGLGVVRREWLHDTCVLECGGLPVKVFAV